LRILDFNHILKLGIWDIPAHEKNEFAVNNSGKYMSEINTPETTLTTKQHKNAPSDARIILGPLVKYALIGLVLVSVIITTAVTLDRQFNDIDREIAALEAELAAANQDDGTDPAAISNMNATDAPVVNAVERAVTTNINEDVVVNENTETEKPMPASGTPENRVEAATAM
jgi:hypothetical protein